MPTKPACFEVLLLEDSVPRKLAALYGRRAGLWYEATKNAGTLTLLRKYIPVCHGADGLAGLSYTKLVRVCARDPAHTCSRNALYVESSAQARSARGTAAPAPDPIAPSSDNKSVVRRNCDTWAW